MTLHQPQGKIGYLVKSYPKISETFILREILALEDEGVELEIFSLRRPKENKLHAVTAKVRAKVSYIPSSFLDDPIAFLWNNLMLLLTHPRRYFRALRFVVNRQESERFKDFLQACHLASSIKASAMRHLHAHFINKPTGVAELANLLTGLPYSITAHAKDIYLSSPAELSRKMKPAKFVVTCNEYNRRFLQNLSTDDTPAFRIYHGLDIKHFRPEVRESAEGLPLILSIGRLREKKGFLCLIDACRLLKVGGYKFRCVIAGYGPLQGEIERRIAEFDLGDVILLTGMLTLDEVIEYYKRATLFALPCQITEDGDRDGIPNVLVEAMAMELPVVSTDVSGIPELVEHMQNGLLIRPEDPVGLAASVARLLDQPRLRQELGKAGRRKVCEQFSSKRNALQLRALFHGMSAPAPEYRQENTQVAKKDAEDQAA